MNNSIRITLADDGTVTVSVLGEIDFSSSDDVAQGIRDALVDWSPSAVRVDLAEATFVDSTGLGALIEGYRDATDRGISFAVANPTDNFRRVLNVTGLSDFFGLIDADAAATSPEISEPRQAQGA
ncbi:STAS domain-containing protein [Actinoplanes sp. CA-015351]|uniref:STAS domain-containing protein n=1 Tax=Actinoplanes sp. CA-015351 TaxID=3239897 RepID=UPI003D95484E